MRLSMTGWVLLLCAGSAFAQGDVDPVDTPGPLLFLEEGDVVEPLPAVILIHEWWGLNDNVRAMANRLAGEGYMVLAVDLYNGEVAESREAARQLMLQVVEDRKVAGEHALGALDRKRRQYVTTFLRALGYAESGEELLAMFDGNGFVANTLDRDTTEDRDEALLDLGQHGRRCKIVE